MKKFIRFYFAAAVLFFAAACSEKEDTPTGDGGENVALKIAEYTLNEKAVFGETLSFTVKVEGSASNVTVAVISEGSQLAGTTVRESEGGVFSGEISLPYTKNIADGDYDVMIMAIGTNSSERDEKTLKIALSHPSFSSVAFVASDGQKFEMKAEGSLWSFTGNLPASLSGVFEAKVGSSVFTFGGSNVDNVEFGNQSTLPLYSYSNPLSNSTLTFDVISFAVTFPLEPVVVAVPVTTDVANPGTIDVEFKKGQIVIFENLGNLWVDVDFFDNNGDGTYTFRAEGGYYRLTNQSDWGSLRTERVTVNGDLGTFRWDDKGITVNEAIWCLGNYNFGKPDKRAIRDGRVFSDWETYDAYCMAKIDDYKYQITLRVYNWASYKFFQTKLDWGDIYGTNYNLDKSNLNNLCYIYNNIFVGNGNFQQGTGESDPNLIQYPESGQVIRFTFDVSKPLGIIVTAEAAEM
ncbi:MAG: DUF5125 domain-containing protein [Bacteroidales bacterium]|nr:DUF5125 domain-containing protein [Bacteroidales bacterium]